MYQFDPDQLDRRVAEVAAQFQSGSPFRHFVIDDFIDSETIASINEEFVELSARRKEWQQFESGSEVKFALADITKMGPVTVSVLTAFNSHPFVSFIEQVTAMDGIVPDPGFVGGGMHEIASGGFLKIHADFNRHKHLRLDRRLNVILYLNHDWDESWGGQLELWDRTMSNPVVSLAPHAGRLVCFATDDYSYHGHPDPISCPPDRFRRSLALYYYTNGRPSEEVSGEHTTLFKERPGERIPRTFVDAMTRLRAVKRRVAGASSVRR